MGLLDTTGQPIYQHIARKASQLWELELSDRVIGKRLGVTDKTAAKAMRWLQRVQLRAEEGVDLVGCSHRTRRRARPAHATRLHAAMLLKIHGNQGRRSAGDEARDRP